MDDYGLGRLLGYIQDRSYIGSSDAPYSGSPSRKENSIPEKGYEPIQSFIPGLADIAGAWASGSDLGMFYDLMGLQPVDGSPNLVKDLSNTLNIDGETIRNTLNDALAAAGLDQQGNPLKEDDLSNPLLAPNPLLADEAANTGPKPLDELSPEEIMEVYKDRKIDDLIRDFPTDEGGKFPFDFVQSILINSANEGDKNAAQILMNSGVPIAGPEGAFDGDGPAAGTGDPAASGAESTSTPTGGTPQGQTVTPQGETSTPQGGTPTPQGGTPQGGTQTGAVPANATPAIDSPIGTPTVSTGLVFDQTDTGDVTVDDQPISVTSTTTPTTIPPAKQ